MQIFAFKYLNIIIKKTTVLTMADEEKAMDPPMEKEMEMEKENLVKVPKMPSFGDDDDGDYESVPRRELLETCCCCFCVCENTATRNVTCCCCCPIKCGV